MPGLATSQLAENIMPAESVKKAGRVEPAFSGLEQWSWEV